MENKESQSIGLKTFGKTLEVWEKYKELEPSFQDFLEVVDVCLGEIREFQDSKENLNNLLCETQYWLEFKCRELDEKVLPLISLLRALSFHNVVYTNKSSSIAQIFMKAVGVKLQENSGNSEVFVKIAVEILVTFEEINGKVRVFMENQEFQKDFEEFLTAALKGAKVLATGIEVIFLFLQVFEQLYEEKELFRKNFVGKVNCNLVLDVFGNGISQGSNEETLGILQILRRFTLKLVEFDENYLEYTDFSVVCTEICKKGLNEGVEYIEFLLNSFKTHTSSNLTAIIRILLLPNLDESLYLTSCQSLKQENSIKNPNLASDLRIQILKSGNFPNKLFLFDALSCTLPFHFPVIELKHLLHQGITFPQSTPNVFSIISQSLHDNTDPSKYFSLSNREKHSFKPKKIFHCKDLTISFRFYLYEIDDFQEIFTISNESSKSFLHLHVQNGKISVVLKFDEKSENLIKKEELGIRGNQWISLSICLKNKQKNVAKSEIVLFLNNFEYKFVVADSIRYLLENTTFEINFSGMLEFFLILSNSLNGQGLETLMQLRKPYFYYLNSLMFQWNGESGVPESDFYNCSEKPVCNHTKNTDIYESLQALGGAKALLLQVTSQRTLISFLQILQKFQKFSPETLFDSDFFVIFRCVLEKTLQNSTESELVETLENLKIFISDLNDSLHYSLAVENLLFNMTWSKLPGEYLIKLFDIIVTHPLKYGKIGSISEKIPQICNFFNSFIKVLATEHKTFIYPYYFYVLKQFIWKLKEEKDSELFILIVSKVTEENSNVGILNHLPEFFSSLVQIWKLSIEENSCFISILDIVKGCVDCGNGFDAIVLNLVFNLYFKAITLYTIDEHGRPIDFKTDYFKEVELLRDIYKQIKEILNSAMRVEICNEIINFIEKKKYDIIINYVERTKLDKANIYFTNLITGNLPKVLNWSLGTFNDIVQTLIELCKKSYVLEKIVKNESFPGWTFEIFQNQSKNLAVFSEFIAILFTKMPVHLNLCKLRILIFNLIGNNYEKALHLFYMILTSEQSLSYFKEFPMYFIEMLNITEDLTYHKEFIQNHLTEFKDILHYLIKLSDKINIRYSLNFPKGPELEFFEYLCKPPTTDNNEKNIFFRDGGVCRQLLKLIFFVMDFGLDPGLEDKILEIFQNGKALDEEKEWKKIREKNIERLSFFGSKVQKNSKGIVYVYVFVEWRKILKNYPQGSVSFNEFCEKYDIGKKVKKIGVKNYIAGFPQQWKRIKDLIEISHALCEKYSFLMSICEISSISSINIELKSIEKTYKNLSDLLEAHLTILTSLKMDILSDFYIVKKVSYKFQKEPEAFRSRSNSENFLSLRNQIDQLSIISKNKKKELEKTMILPDFATENRVFHIRSNFDNIGRKPLLKGKSKQKRIVNKKNSIEPVESIRTSFEFDLNSSTTMESSELSTEIKDSINEGVETVNIQKEEEVVEISNKKQVELEAEIIFIKGSFYGTAVINSQSIMFHSKSSEKPVYEEFIIKSDEDITIRASALHETQIRREVIKIWNYFEIKEIIARRFIHTHSAIEIFLTSGKSKFLNFFSHKNCNLALASLKSFIKPFKIPILSRSSLKKIMELWKSGKISNFDYLLLLNKYAGRSFNDLSQYPIFPWILKDYKSPDLKLSADDSIYRDLRFPIGAQTVIGKKAAGKRFEISLKDQVIPYHYGSHYSNGGIVLHYLLRLEPFTTQSINLQGGRFDIPDRMFISLNKSWKHSQSYNSDVKELIPEMFFLPEIFMNLNEWNFGKRQNKKVVNDVQLPNWAKNSKFNFIRLHRKALESQYVSQNIHHWIDMIFGYKQQGKAAKEAFNMYFPVTYEENFLKMLQSAEPPFQISLIHQVIHFGQTPIQLFTNRHPKRDEILIKPSLSERILKKPYFSFDLVCESTHSLISVLFTIKYLLVLKYSTLHTMLKLKYSENFIEISNISEVMLQGLPLTPCKVSAIFKEDFIVTAGYENSYIYFSGLAGELLKVVNFHTAFVKCLAGGNILTSGSSDSTLVVFDYENSKSLFGHMSEINLVCNVEDWGIVVSSSFDQVLIHDYRTGEAIRQILINCTGLQANNNGVFCIETPKEYFVYYANGQEMMKGEKEKNSKSCLIGDSILYYTGKNFICVDYYENKIVNVETEKELEISKIVFDYKKETIFIIENRTSCMLKVLREIA